MPISALDGASEVMIPSRWVGRVVLTTMTAVVLAGWSLTMPLVLSDAQNSAYRDDVVYFGAAMIWIWMFLAIYFVGLLLYNYSWGSLILGWILAVDSIAALTYLSAKLDVADSGLAHGAGLGWWFLAIAVVLQALAVTMRTYTVLSDYKDRRAWIEAPQIEDSPKPT